MYLKPDLNKTPRSDALEHTRIELNQQRTPAYGDALALCRQLERELNTLTWDYEELRDRT